MGNSQRRKGATGELELAKLLGADKISGMYLKGPDLRWRGRYLEVKRRAHWPSKALEKWRNDADIVMFRVDREQWMVYCDLATWLELIESE